MIILVFIGLSLGIMVTSTIPKKESDVTSEQLKHQQQMRLQESLQDRQDRIRPYAD